MFPSQKTYLMELWSFGVLELWSFGVHISAWLVERCSEKSQWRHVSLMRVLSLIISFL